MHVQVARVFQRTEVQRAVQMLTHSGLIEQTDLIAHAAPLYLVVESTQFAQVRGLHRRVQVAVLEVAVNGVRIHALLDDLVTTPAQVPDEVVHLRAKAVAHLPAHGLIARQAAGDLPTIAPTGAPADPVGFDNRDLEPAFSQLDGTGNAGEAAADNHHVNADLALQGRVLGSVVEAGGVIRSAALGSTDDRAHGCEIGRA